MRRTWTQDEVDLWSRVAAHSFEIEGHVLTFTGRLARDHNWVMDLARGAVEEYRRFCFLAVVSDSEVTPSEEVDEVWHLHLTFSRDYWQQWCPNVLCRSLHHQPTTGGRAESNRFAEQYARTLALYEMYFGPPDVLYWPGTAQRFATRPRFCTIDQNRTLMISGPRVLIRIGRHVSRVLGLAGLFSALGAGPASATTWDILDWTGGSFLFFYACIAGLALTIAHLLATAIRSRRATTQRPAPVSLDVVDLAFLSGGNIRAADALTLQLIEAGYLALAGDRIFVPVSLSGPEPPPTLAAFRVFQGQSMTRQSMIKVMEPWLDTVWNELARAGLAIRRSELKQIRSAFHCCLWPVIALGSLKIIVGLSRDKPVGFLCGLVLLTGFLALWLPTQQTIATIIGERALSAYYNQHARAIRAPLPHEAIMAFAFMGAMALQGTAFASYADLIKPQSDSGGGGCGSDGGGGGGCGGCGGGH